MVETATGFVHTFIHELVHGPPNGLSTALPPSC